LSEGDCVNVIGPRLQGVAHLGFVTIAIVDPRHASAEA
jgi:hypothetical protein